MSTAEETPNSDAATRRLRMGILMSALTLALFLAWLVSPFAYKFALIFVGMTTGVYAVFNLLMFRVRRRETA